MTSEENMINGGQCWPLNHLSRGGGTRQNWGALMGNFSFDEMLEDDDGLRYPRW